MEKGLSRDARAIGERSALRRIISASNCYYNREQRTRTPAAVADDADNEKNRLQKKTPPQRSAAAKIIAFLSVADKK